MLTIGLTGGIGSGKTMITNLFTMLGASTIDTDIIAREVVAPNTPALHAITKHFGSSVINADGSLNRRQLRNIIFNNNLEKKWLEKLLHPLIRAGVQQKLAIVEAPYCILVIPLLLENNRAIPVDRVLVIDVPPAIQIQRVQNRDQISAAEVEAIINHQLSREQRLAAADDVIINDSDHISALLYQQVENLHQFYLSLAAS